MISARHLIQGYQLKLQNKIYEPKIDIASIAILTRAAMETYLTFNHVFVAEEDDKKRELRFLSWDLAGYLERASFVAKLEEHVILKEKEIERAQNRIKQIKSLDAFNNLNSKRQKHIIDGNWRAGFTWFDLAVEAGFNPDFFFATVQISL
ncbi:MAG: hypothetical protein IPH24_15260 [Crocinitomicaceae bacterium]|nr:hypothetical protein [Crocinitomicaceae bacterium]